MNLVISETAIRQDKNGRYCLNDLHKAAGSEKRHQPGNWIRTESAQELAQEFNSSDMRIKAVAIKRGATGGTFVVKEMVYAYAMWISPKFHLHVIRTFDAVMTQKDDWRKQRHLAASTNKLMQQMLQETRKEIGKETQSHHYSNEARLINWAITGEFCSLERNELSAHQLDVLAALESRNALLIGRGVEYAKRKIILEQLAIDMRKPELKLVGAQ
jgi:hypothetical protein